MRILATYLFKMYRPGEPGHRKFRYKTFLCWDVQEAMEEADEWADCNGYVDYELVKEDRT